MGRPRPQPDQGLEEEDGHHGGKQDVHHPHAGKGGEDPFFNAGLGNEGQDVIGKKGKDAYRRPAVHVPALNVEAKKNREQGKRRSEGPVETLHSYSATAFGTPKAKSLEVSAALTRLSIGLALGGFRRTHPLSNWMVRTVSVPPKTVWTPF